MPKRNVIKEYDSDSYYHLYTRGVDKQLIFREENDYTVFASLFKRYLAHEISKMPNRMPYKNFSQEISLIAYAFMPNHLHLFIYQGENNYAIRDFMRALLTSYSMYFNKKYKRVGPLFQSRYLGSRIVHESYFEHISRYIHMNPSDWKTSKHTSLDFFIGKRHASWIHPERVLTSSPETYFRFLDSYTDSKALLEEIKWNLANDE